MAGWRGVVGAGDDPARGVLVAEAGQGRAAGVMPWQAGEVQAGKSGRRAGRLGAASTAASAIWVRSAAIMSVTRGSRSASGLAAGAGLGTGNHLSHDRSRHARPRTGRVKHQYRQRGDQVSGGERESRNGQHVAGTGCYRPA